jgi:hypothetical protein
VIFPTFYQGNIYKPSSPRPPPGHANRSPSLLLEPARTRCELGHYPAHWYCHLPLSVLRPWLVAQLLPCEPQRDQRHTSTSCALGHPDVRIPIHSNNHEDQEARHDSAVYRYRTNEHTVNDISECIANTITNAIQGVGSTPLTRLPWRRQNIGRMRIKRYCLLLRSSLVDFAESDYK